MSVKVSIHSIPYLGKENTQFYYVQRPRNTNTTNAGLKGGKGRDRAREQIEIITEASSSDFSSSDESGRGDLTPCVSFLRYPLTRNLHCAVHDPFDRSQSSK